MQKKRPTIKKHQSKSKKKGHANEQMKWVYAGHSGALGFGFVLYLVIK